MSESSLVRISGKAKQTLEVLAKQSGEPMSSVMDRAIEAYRRRVFLEETNRAYAKLRADKKASQAFDDDIAAWDATLMDGLEPAGPAERGRPGKPKRKEVRKS